MDIKQLILDALHNAGCAVIVDGFTGITTVRTPDHHIWNFTTPKDVTKDK